MDSTGIREAVEIKGSDRSLKDSSEIKGLLDFAEENKLVSPRCLSCSTLAKQDARYYGNKKVVFIPTSLYCFLLGQSLNSSEFREELLKSAVQTEPASANP